MGQTWDGALPPVEVWAEALRVAKPGAHLLAFGGTRTFHRLTCAIEDAGWEIRDCLMWLYGTGFPKSKNLDGERKGCGTALKPAWEPIILARKPLCGTVAQNVQAHGTGSINVDGCRIGVVGGGTHCGNRGPDGRCLGHKNEGRSTSGETFHGPDSSGGRWPANLVLDEEAGRVLDEQSGQSSSKRNENPSDCGGNTWGGTIQVHRGARGHTDSGGASRFFYCAKARRGERGDGNSHPTVKPVALMRWLCRLVTPPGGTILDPFCGSGSTGVAALDEGFDFIGIERDHGYCEIARGRITEKEARR